MISNKQMNDIMKIVKPFQESGLLIKKNQIMQKEIKEQKGGFLSKLLGTLGPSLLQILLTDKDTIKAVECKIRVS